MGKKTSPYELILFLHNGLKPIDIIKMGYSKHTVYKYSSIHYPKALEVFKNKIKGV